MDYYRMYEEEIRLFFREEMPDYHFMSTKEKWHVWIAGRHRSFQVLTIEPPDGGQYEIAVRFPLCSSYPNVGDEYSGYIACENGTMVGRNTDGH